jgi:hypothetical protein
MCCGLVDGFKKVAEIGDEGPSVCRPMALSVLEIACFIAFALPQAVDHRDSPSFSGETRRHADVRHDACHIGLPVTAVAPDEQPVRRGVERFPRWSEISGPRLPQRDLPEPGWEACSDPMARVQATLSHLQIERIGAPAWLESSASVMLWTPQLRADELFPLPNTFSVTRPKSSYR